MDGLKTSRTRTQSQDGKDGQSGVIIQPIFYQQLIINTKLRVRSRFNMSQIWLGSQNQGSVAFWPEWIGGFTWLVIVCTWQRNKKWLVCEWHNILTTKFLKILVTCQTFGSATKVTSRSAFGKLAELEHFCLLVLAINLTKLLALALIVSGRVFRWLRNQRR